MFAGMFRTEIQDSNTFVPTNDWCIAAPNQQLIEAEAEAKKHKNSDNDDYDWGYFGCDSD